MRTRGGRIQRLARKYMKAQESIGPLEKEILTLLADLCQRRGQTGMAAELGISLQYMNDLARGRRGVSYELARKISELR